jgi:hypothetical protein
VHRSLVRVLAAVAGGFFASGLMSTQAFAAVPPPGPGDRKPSCNIEAHRCDPTAILPGTPPSGGPQRPSSPGGGGGNPVCTILGGAVFPALTLIWERGTRGLNATCNC